MNNTGNEKKQADWLIRIPIRLIKDPTISSTAFRLFVVISSLSSTKGYCFASNAKLATELGALKRDGSASAKRTVQRRLFELQEKSYIFIKYADGQRRLYPVLSKEGKALPRGSDVVLHDNNVIPYDMNDTAPVTSMPLTHDISVTHSNSKSKNRERPLVGRSPKIKFLTDVIQYSLRLIDQSVSSVLCQYLSCAEAPCDAHSVQRSVFRRLHIHT